MANIVAIVGRPNVGKSTLFNRLVERRDAIMDNQSGVTRDRHYGKVTWTNKSFTVIDTGGYVVGSEDTFEAAIRDQVAVSLEEASVVLFVVDCITGLTDLDKDFAKVLRRSDKPVYLVANKADDTEKLYAANEFYELSMGDPFPIAAVSGSGTGDLLDAVVNHFEEDEEETDEKENNIPRISVIGRPNVGKSSFVNFLLNNNRSIVTDIAGTTRDAVDAHYNAFGHEFILTDTAGIRRKSRVHENIEFYSVMRSIKAIENSDICVLVVDATNGVESQDVNIINLAIKNKKGVVLMVNKWDLVEKSTNTARDVEREIRTKLPHLPYLPIIFASVHEKQRVMKVIEKAVTVYENKRKKIPTSQLNEAMLKEIENYPPPSYRGKYIKIKYITQIPTYNPTFAFFCNFPKHIKDPYKKYLENKLRSHFDFEGVPVQLVFRNK
ncbi:ribosome biogenesis GTPase Der [Limibacter armeniacum]|uniref:ribosome biogenesis GTPase Der n=1 Tax=Limibacter armeniacum TaxID=466084 RepID=UPI002FE4FCEB